VRHTRWGSALHPYLGFGAGMFRHRYFRTGDDVTSSNGGQYVTFGANTPLRVGHVLGLDIRAAKVKRPVDNPVFRRYAEPFGFVPGPSDPALTPLKGPNVHWSVKLSYSLTR
jgi:hypothetical protein